MYCNNTVKESAGTIGGQGSGRNRNRVRRAFSFIEIMIVVVIIGILAGVVTLSTRHYLDRAKVNRARADLATFKNALESYYGEAGRYPTTDEGLATLAPKFIERLPFDPWGRAYLYVQPGRSSAYEVVCYGADGKNGGDGADADLSSADEPVAIAAQKGP